MFAEYSKGVPNNSLMD